MGQLERCTRRKDTSERKSRAERRGGAERKRKKEAVYGITVVSQLRLDSLLVTKRNATAYSNLRFWEGKNDKDAYEKNNIAIVQKMSNKYM